MQACSDLLNAFTQMLEPRDEMELIWTKEATDATWEAGREAQKKNGLISVAQPATALDHRRRRLPDHLLVKHLLAQRYGAEQAPSASARSGAERCRDASLEAGFKYYRGLDVAQSRAIR